jgi:hypothetical protein
VVTVAAAAVCVLLAALALFQALLAFGLPLGRFAWGGQHRVLPMALRLGSLASILVYALVAAVVAGGADLHALRVPNRLVEVTTWVAVGYFFLGLVLNLASRSRAERIVMSSICAMLAILCGVVALG